MGCPSSKDDNKQRKPPQGDMPMPASMMGAKPPEASAAKKIGGIPPLSVRGSRPPQPLGGTYQKGSLSQSTIVKQPVPAVVKQLPLSVSSSTSDVKTNKSKKSSQKSSKRRHSSKNKTSISSASDRVPPAATFNYTKSNSPPQRGSLTSASNYSSQSSASATYMVEYNTEIDYQHVEGLCNRNSLLDSAFDSNRSLRCLIVGATQQGTSLSISGCSKSIDSAYDAVARCGADVSVLRDDTGSGSNQDRRPTYYRVLQEINDMVSRCRQDDTFLIIFIGHCCDVAGMAAFIPSGYDNVSYPDVISGEEVRSLLIRLPKSCATVLVLDVPTPSVNSMLPVSSSWFENGFTNDSLPACELRIKTPGNRDEGLCGKLALAVGSLVVRERSVESVRDVPSLLYIYNIFKSYRRPHYIPDLGHINLSVASSTSFPKLRSITTTRSVSARRSNRQVFSPPVAGRLNATYLNPLDDLADESWISVNSHGRYPR